MCILFSKKSWNSLSSFQEIVDVSTLIVNSKSKKTLYNKFTFNNFSATFQEFLWDDILSLIFFAKNADTHKKNTPLGINKDVSLLFHEICHKL